MLADLRLARALIHEAGSVLDTPDAVAEQRSSETGRMLTLAQSLVAGVATASERNAALSALCEETRSKFGLDRPRGQ